MFCVTFCNFQDAVMRRFIYFKFKIMIKKEELRIGNWIFIEDLEVKVECLPKHYNYEVVNSIKLTDEWLIKFKFKKQDDGFLYKNLKIMGTRLEINMNKKLICLTHNGITMDVVHLPYIKHVHQLQNLYFALTGGELDLSSNVV